MTTPDPASAPLAALKQALRAHAGLRVEETPDAVVVKTQDAAGFDVGLFRNGDGYTVSFDGWHEHFAPDDGKTAIACFAHGLSGQARLRVLARGGFDYRWTLESFEDGAWREDSTTGLSLFPFWRKRTARHLRNPERSLRLA